MRFASRWLRRLTTETRRSEKNRRLRSPRMNMLCLEDRVVPTVNLGFEVEPNNTSLTAMPVGNDIKVRGQTLFSGDLDWYSFSANAGDRVFAATMTSGSASSFDSYLTLFASDGSTIIEFDNDDGTLGSTSSSIAGASIPVNGTYYLQVKGGTGATLQLRDYDLYLTVRSGAATAEVEPNDSLGTAQALSTTGGWINGSTSSATDSDFYGIALSAGDTVFLSLDCDPERDGTTWNGQLGFQPFGGPTLLNLIANDANVTSPNSEALFFTVKDAGTYYVQVVSQGATTFGTYQLSASVLTAPTVAATFTNSTVTPLTDVGITTSDITIPTSQEIGSLMIAINLTHNLMQDLDVDLTAPNGTKIALFNDIGSTTAGSQTTMNIILSEGGAFPIGVYTAVAGLVCQPEAAYRLSWLNGMEAQGTWTLTLRDDLATNTGTLNSWSIMVVAPPAAPAGTPTVVFGSDFEANDGGFTHSGTQDEWEWGVPTAAPATGAPINTAFSGTNVWATDLDDSYNASANQDLFSPNIDLTAISPGTDIQFNWAMKYSIESASFDKLFVEVQEVGGAGATRKVFEWTGATMSASVGNPSVTIYEASGWGKYHAAINDFAGKTIRLRYNLSSDTSVQYTGVAIDDVSIVRYGALNPAPVATASGATINTAGGTSHTVSVTYTDNVGSQLIDYSTISKFNVRVLAPDLVTYLLPTSATPNPDPMGDAKSITVDYVIPSLGANWDDTDNGMYQIQVIASQVFDKDMPTPFAVAAGKVGTFSVAIPKTYTVNVVSDTDDLDPMNGMTTLREAIRLANTDASPSVISFDVGMFGTPQTIMVGSTYSITEPVTIGAPATLLTLQSLGGDFRGVDINLTIPGGAVSMSRLAVMAFSVTGNGGGISNANADLTLAEMVVGSNTASVNGGGIALGTTSAKLTMTKSVVHSNITTTNDGAGIYLGASTTLNINQSVVRDNIADSTGGDGAGIFAAAASTITIQNSTISGNIAKHNSSVFGGGGIYINDASVLTINNSTISGNQSAGGGGGIHIDDATGILNLNNSTVVGNAAGVGFTGSGGGINVRVAGGKANIVSSIIANNTAVTSGPDIFGAATIEASNVSNDAGSTLTQVGTNLVNVDPMVGALANNGGFVLPDGSTIQTHSITSSSPVLDQGRNNLPQMTDQRGSSFGRTVNYPVADLYDGTDIGAFELQMVVVTPPTVTSVLTNGAVGGQRSMVTSFVVTFSETVTIANPSMAFQINRYAGATNGDTPATGLVGFTVAGLDAMNQGSSVTISFNGTGAVGVDPSNSLRDGKYEVIVVATEIVGANGFLDGNGNGTYDPMDPLMDNNRSTSWRLFGDGNGDGSVTASDFNDFRLFYGSTGNPAAFPYDFDNSGSITAADFNQFRTRYGLSGYNMP